MGTKTNLLKRLVRRSADLLYGAPLLDRLWVERLKGRAICLCYHRVDPGGTSLDFLGKFGVPTTTPASFRHDIRTLKEWGFKFVTFRAWKKAGGLDPDRPHAIVTLDDGYKDQYTQARKILDAEGVKAVFFQSTALVQSTELVWAHKVFDYCRDRTRCERLLDLCRQVAPEHLQRARSNGHSLAHYLIEEMPYELSQKLEAETRQLLPPDAERRLAKRLHPTRREIEEAVAAGHEIGCHGHRHLKRSTVSLGTFAEDLQSSVERLQKWFGEKPISYAFPYGNYSLADLPLISQHFDFVTTVEPGIIDDQSDKRQLPRFYHREPAKSQVRRQRWLLTGFG